MDKLEYLRNIIRKTGYPLEIQISSLLDKRWDVVLNTDSYYDREEEKLRDIDIVTSRTHFYQGTNVTLQTGLVIECKKTEKYAWVFFTRPFSFDHTEVTGQYLDKIQCVTNNLEKSNFLDEILFQPELMHYADFKRVSVAYSEFILKSESVDRTNKHEIFEAQNKLKNILIANMTNL